MLSYTKLIVLIISFAISNLCCAQERDTIRSVSLTFNVPFELGFWDEENIDMKPVDLFFFYFSLDRYHGLHRTVYYKRSWALIRESFTFSEHHISSVPLGPHGSPPIRKDVLDVEYRYTRTSIGWQHNIGFWINPKKSFAIELGISGDLIIRNSFTQSIIQSGSYINGEELSYTNTPSGYEALVSKFTLSPNVRFKATGNYFFPEKSGLHGIGFGLSFEYNLRTMNLFKTEYGYTDIKRNDQLGLVGIKFIKRI